MAYTHTVKVLHKMNTGDSGCEGKRGDIEDTLSELNVNYESFETPLTESSQAKNIVTADMPASHQQALGDQMEMRSLYESLVQAQVLSTRGAAAYVRFMSTGDVEDIDKAIEHWGVAAALLPRSLIERLSLLSNLASAYACRFGRLGEVSDLKKAIEIGTETVSLTPDGHEDRPGYLSNLGNSHTARFERLGELCDLNKAIECQAQAVSLTPDDHPDRPACLNNLGVSYTTRFGRLRELSDLNNAIKCQSQTVSLTLDGHPDRPRYLNNLGISYTTRFERLDEFSDLDEAIKCQARAVSLTPDGSPDKPEYLDSLGVSCRARFGRLGELSDLNQAIVYQEQAVSLTPYGHPKLPGYLNNLGIPYKARFERLGDLSDLNRAIECQAQAISLTPDGHSNKPTCLSNLGVSYITRFERLGELSDLNHAIECQAQAVALTHDLHPAMPGRLNNLGNSYTTRFERLDELSDLNKAIECQARAVSLAPDGHPDGPACLNSLGISYMTQFKRLGELSDLNRALECQAQAISLIPDDHPKRPGYLNNLGIPYAARFERLGDLSDLNRAIEYQSQAVALTPDDHATSPGRLNNLGNSYWTRFKRLDELSDLNKGIECQARAISLTPDDHPARPGRLNSLGVSYMTRFGRLGVLLDLNKAIESQARAVSLTPGGHPDKPVRLNNLGISYMARFERQGEISDLKSAGLSFKSASQSLTGPTSVRFYACRQWARQSVRLSSFDPKSSPFPAYQHGMSLIPRLLWIGTTISRRYELVTEVSTFPTEAASYAISTGEYNLALEWLEAGRSIVWGQISQLRSPFKDLSSRHPALAEELASVGRQLEHAGSRSLSLSFPETGGPDLNQEAGAHVQLALKWDRLLEGIRSMSGFEDFLRSPPANRLLKAVKANPIAIINLHESHCDALILQPDSDTISRVALPDFSYEDATSVRTHVFSQVRDRRPGPPLKCADSLQNSLEKLWTSMIKPVLGFLGYTLELPVDQLPHLTWCATGPLSFIPLHAARSLDESQPSTFDFVISSYTPTLSTLLSGQSVDPSNACGILAVGQEDTPNLASLPGTTQELAVIQQHAQFGHYLQLEGSEAKVEQVLDAMDKFSCVHMACHGSQDTNDPTQSAFHLYDGNLTLATITKRSFANKGLAFLSACQTATGDEKMPDEAVHLAAGMLMAGYPSVIGTMWSIADEDGPEVADLVYAELLKDGKMDHTKSAKALHQAVARLREKVGKEDIARWAPFIHIGC